MSAFKNSAMALGRGKMFKRSLANEPEKAESKVGVLL